MSERSDYLEKLGIERLEKIGEMLYWNQNKIDNINSPIMKQLDDYFPTIRVHDGYTEVITHENKIEFNKQVRTRLIAMWNRQLDTMKL